MEQLFNEIFDEITTLKEQVEEMMNEIDELRKEMAEKESSTKRLAK